jgi:enoyl-CoA hydratase
MGVLFPASYYIAVGSKLQFSTDDGIARLTINRPEKRNSVDLDVLDQWLDALEVIRDDATLKGITVRGAEGTFCTGADLPLFLEATERGDRPIVDEFIGKIHRVINALEELDVPVLAVVEEFALAGGLEIMLGCDLRIATTESIIGDEHTKYGLVPGGGATQRLHRQIDAAKANELLFTDRRLTGIEAEKYGLVTRAVPPDQLEEAVEEVESALRSRSRKSLELTKRLVHDGLSTSKRQGLALERHAVIEHYFSEDAKTGFQALAEDKRPEF